jgi:DNA-binding transcriptional LysR family regulator
MRYVLCAAPSYLEQRGAPGHPEELRQHDCLVYGSERKWGEWSFRRPGSETTRVRVAGVVRSASGLVLHAATVAGMGVAQLATLNAGDALRAGRLVEVLRDWPMVGSLEERAVWAVYPSNRAIPPKVRAFVDFLAARIGDPPYWDRDL